MPDSSTRFARRVRAVILAGGESRRMGAPKPGVLIGGETLLARARRVAREATGREALVSMPAVATRGRARTGGNADDRAQMCPGGRATWRPDDRAGGRANVFADVPSRLRVRDARDGCGPAAGLLAALDAPSAAADDAFLMFQWTCRFSTRQRSDD